MRFSLRRGFGEESEKAQESDKPDGCTSLCNTDSGIVFSLVVPQITDTLVSLKDLIPQFFMNVQVMLEKKFSEYPEIVEYINNINLQIDWKDTFEKIAGFVTTGAGTVLLSSTLTAAMSIASGIATFGIAFIFAIYILLQKEKIWPVSLKTVLCLFFGARGK